jgi:ABC-type bacteriocin/lantibiotic exporter with double-glycine peptidase domain
MLVHTEGQVLIDGVDLSRLDATWYRSRLGVVSQEPRLFSLSVRDNICYGCPFTWVACACFCADVARQGGLATSRQPHPGRFALACAALVALQT